MHRGFSRIRIIFYTKLELKASSATMKSNIQERTLSIHVQAVGIQLEFNEYDKKH